MLNTFKRFSFKAMSKSQQQMLLALAILTLIMFAKAASVHAGAGGTEFDEVWDTVKEWIQGSLGRILAGGMILIGIAAGIARQSIMAFAVGIGGGMGLYYSPTIIESIMSATLNTAAQVAPVAAQISNGLGM